MYKLWLGYEIKLKFIYKIHKMRSEVSGVQIEHEIL